jgi:hypothetical protein
LFLAVLKMALGLFSLNRLAYSIVRGNSRVVSPKICTKLGLLRARTVKSAVTVESLPPENDITIFSLGYPLAVTLINSVASSTI